MTDRTRRSLLLAASAAGVSMLAGCGGSSGETEPETSEDVIWQAMAGQFEEYDTWVEDAEGFSADETEDGIEAYVSYWYDHTGGGTPADVQDRVHWIARDLFEAVYATEEEIATVGVIGRVETVDQHGSEGEATFSVIEITQPTAEQITWENFVSENIPDVADRYQFDGHYFA